MSNMDEINRTLREAVAARLAATAAKEAAPAAAILPDVPQAFLDSIAGIELTPVQPVEVREPEPFLLGATMPEGQLAAAWAGIREKADRTRQMAREPEAAAETAELVWSADAGVEATVVGITGRAGAGKNAVASMIPGAFVIGLADPLYAMLSVMLDIPEAILRQRKFKESPIPWVGKSVRQLLQTLGTEWGRGHVCDDIWIRLLDRRITKLIESGITTIAVADVRFENEADYIRQDRGGSVWHVLRPGVEGPAEHASEHGIMQAIWDRVIDNDGTLDDLRKAVLEAWGPEL